jgi:hypothetical protein
MATMQSFFEWFDAKGIDPNQPWLILGKGPSFAKRKEHDLSSYHIMSLNHVVREQAVTVAHMIDYNVVDACGEAILTNAKYLVLPWIPHVNNRPGRRNLEELARMNTVLRKLNEQGRLLWYNHSMARERHGDSPVVRVKFFSAEGALNLLAQAGARTIRSLGVDGGAAYSQDFGDLKDKTLLANGRKSFDQQFEEIARTIAVTGIDYSPLDMESPVKVFVGATEAEMLPAKVLEYSIRKRASMSVEVFPLHRSGISIPLPKDPKQRPRTPFSFQRFLIPALMGYRGRAIYLDSDMQVFKDILDLWAMPIKVADLLTVSEPQLSGRRSQFSVMVLNCETLHWDIREIVQALDEGRLTYEKLVYEMTMVKNIGANIDPEWNALEQFSARETALLHFTDMSIQPWVSKDNPLGYLWTGDLIEAIDAGAVSTDFVKQEIATGHVRPSLMYQVENRIQDAILIPRKAWQMDTKFFPPYRSLPKHHGSLWLRSGNRLRALLRRCYQNTPVPRYQRIFYDWFYR